VDELTDAAERRAHRLLSEGVTTFEVKSGYGLDPETELDMLRAGRRLGERLQASVHCTFLGLHALPPEHASDRASYVRLVVEEILPAAVGEGLVDAVDAFCEGIAFSADECAELFEAARAAGIPVRLHADQLSDGGGAELAARFGALSADHLEYASASGVKAMGESGTVAVLLPGAFHYLGETQKPPVEALRSAGVPIAVATDANPGSSPMLSILTALNLSCVLFGLTVEEALAGATRNAARALGIADRVGTLEPGKRADLAIWDVEHPRDLVYWMGANTLAGVVKDGRPV
jgi:imidazolonepropionase